MGTASQKASSAASSSRASASPGRIVRAVVVATRRSRLLAGIRAKLGLTRVGVEAEEHAPGQFERGRSRPGGCVGSTDSGVTSPYVEDAGAASRFETDGFAVSPAPASQQESKDRAASLAVSSRETRTSMSRGREGMLRRPRDPCVIVEQHRATRPGPRAPKAPPCADGPPPPAPHTCEPRAPEQRPLPAPASHQESKDRAVSLAGSSRKTRTSM